VQIARPLRSALRTAVVLGLSVASLCLTRPALASPDYPAALAAAIAERYPQAVKCVPLCNACHLTTQGGPGNIIGNKFGENLENKFGLLKGNAALVKGAFDKLADADPDSDGDSIHDVEEIIAGNSPSLPYPQGQDQFCPDINYGCGARIAPAPPPPVAGLALFSAGLGVLGVIVARRRRAALRTRRSTE
jgi:hypothetical protein